MTNLSVFHIYDCCSFSIVSLIRIQVNATTIVLVHIDAIWQKKIFSLPFPFGSLFNFIQNLILQVFIASLIFSSNKTIPFLFTYNPPAHQTINQIFTLSFSLCSNFKSSFICLPIFDPNSSLNTLQKWNTFDLEP